MKIQITQRRELPSGKVKPGDILEAPKDGTEEELRAYVQNGIAIEVKSEEKGVKSSPLTPDASPVSSASPLTPNTSPLTEGE